MGDKKIKVVLDIVKNELPMLILADLDKVINREKTIAEEVFGDTGGEKREYFRLTATSGPQMISSFMLSSAV